MKNFVQPGDVLTLASPYARDAGEGALVGTIFGVAVNNAANGDPCEFALGGVFDLRKVGSQAWTVGALVYWDDTNKYCTTTASGNTLIGKAVLAVGGGSTLTTGRVLLTEN